MVNPAKLRNEFEKYAMEICNDVGVDINRVIRHKHLGSHEMVGGVHMRQELFNNVVQRNVYINCIGFIKIRDVDVYSNNNNDMDVLDMTRIHPDCNIFPNLNH
jgi:transcriptional accessory protein Tex/SPT6